MTIVGGKNTFPRSFYPHSINIKLNKKNLQSVKFAKICCYSFLTSKFADATNGGGS